LPIDHGSADERRRMTRALRRWIIEQSLASNVGHVGSALGIVDIMAALWCGVMDRPGTRAPERDRFVLGKGHAALALYSALRFKGLLDERAFRTYCGDGSALGVHPEHVLPGVDVSTGSLGQGLSIGCGLAFAFRNKNVGARVYALLSDAECNEGQVWEAAMFAAHHRLANLTVVVDLNGLQALGHTKDVLGLSAQAAAWSAFGWDAREVDGHDAEALLDALQPRESGAPRAVIARTVLGKGVPFMEDQLDWHYRNLTAEQAHEALLALDALP
jgi:transketolase